MTLVSRPLVLDTCVLLSNVVRRLIFSLARQNCCRPFWSQVIGEEWRRNAVRIWQIAPEDANRQWGQFDEDFPQANLGDVDAYKQGLFYSDAKDWHVIAAARAARERYAGELPAIVTYNTRDFRRSELRRLNVDLLDPDQLLLALWTMCRPQLQHELELLRELAQVDDMQQGQAFVSGLLKRERLFRFNKQYLAGLAGNS